MFQWKHKSVQQSLKRWRKVGLRSGTILVVLHVQIWHIKSKLMKRSKGITLHKTGLNRRNL